MKKALITGPFGQDGSYLCELLTERNYEVHGIVREPLSANSECIKNYLALKCIELNKKTGADIKVIDYYESLNDPGTPIPEKATMINGIKDEDVKGKSINW